LLDLKKEAKEGVDAAATEYLCISYKDELCRELDLQYKNDLSRSMSHLILVLPDAGRFFSTSAANLQVPEHATIRVIIDTYKAPDIAMFVRQRLRGASKAPGDRQSTVEGK